MIYELRGPEPLSESTSTADEELLLVDWSWGEGEDETAVAGRGGLWISSCVNTLSMGSDDGHSKWTTWKT